MIDRFKERACADPCASPSELDVELTILMPCLDEAVAVQFGL